MPDQPEATPEPVEAAHTTGPISVLENKGERLRSILRIAFSACLGILLMGDVAFYSLHQAMKSQVDSQEHRIERLNSMISDLLMSNQNSEKIEKIEQQVNGIDGQVQAITDAIKRQDKKAAEAEAEAEAEPKKKKKR